MAATSINCLAVVLKELGWSYTRLIAELRREAAVDGIVLPKTESLIPLISRWVNNHQQPDEFYRELLSRATGRHRFELFSDEAAIALLAARTNSGIAPIVAVGSDEDMTVASCWPGQPRSPQRWRPTRSCPYLALERGPRMPSWNHKPQP
jgi:hypothetical protein